MIDSVGANVYCRKRVPDGVPTLTPAGGALEKIGSARVATLR